MIEDEETAPCAHCFTPTTIEDLTHYGEDSDFCPKCSAEWEAHFAACSHEWATADENGEDYHDEHGDAAKFCHRCSGMLVLDGVP